jgi:hypothetical protein
MAPAMQLATLETAHQHSWACQLVKAWSGSTGADLGEARHRAHAAVQLQVRHVVEKVELRVGIGQRLQLREPRRQRRCEPLQQRYVLLGWPDRQTDRQTMR